MASDADASRADAYDYTSMVEAAAVVLKSLVGHVLERSLVHVVGGEFNILYLLFAEECFSIHGRVGGEVLQIVPLDEKPTCMPVQDGIGVTEYPAFESFSGKRIASARTIGSAWNGHGFEFSFEGLYNRTMIVQSIDTGVSPPGFGDCLRLGVGIYDYEWSDAPRSALRRG